MRQNCLHQTRIRYRSHATAATHLGTWKAATRSAATLIAAISAVLILAKVALGIPESWLDGSFIVPRAKSIGEGIGNLGI